MSVGQLRKRLGVKVGRVGRCQRRGRMDEAGEDEEAVSVGLGGGAGKPEAGQGQ